MSVGLNLTDRKISEFFSSIFGLSISAATVCNMRLKLKKYLRNEYNVLEEKICESSVSHMDETGLKKKSKNEWLLVISSLKEVVYNIEIIRKISNEYFELGKELGMLGLNSLLHLGQ
ncbi:MAG: IS66 family transposase [Candidatus Heimdallarchaeaceae archaeon]